MIRFKTIVTVFVCVVLGWSACKVYAYFFDHTEPIVTLLGIDHDQWCSDELHFQVSTDKSCTVSVLLDDTQELEHGASVNSKNPYTCVVPTRTMADGTHHLTVVCTDNTYRHNSVSRTCSFCVDNTPLQALFLDEPQLRVLQGRTLHVQFQVNKEIDRAKVHALAESYDCFVASKEQKVYECYIPISCEEKPNEYLFSVEIKDRVGNKIVLDNKFEILAGAFKKQNIQIGAQKIEEEKRQGRSELELEEHLLQLTKSSPCQKLWQGQFCAPIEIERVTCEFGTLRTSQERGRYRHKAVDIISHPKSVVWATHDGVVVLKDRYDVSGNTVVVDHGFGVLSLFYHLDDFADIQVGQKITKGKPIGTLGKTGYATGYHLHWEMRVNNLQVDPMQWTHETF